MFSIPCECYRGTEARRLDEFLIADFPVDDVDRDAAGADEFVHHAVAQHDCRRSQSLAVDFRAFDVLAVFHVAKQVNLRVVLPTL